MKNGAKKVQDFLKTHHMGILSTVSKDGKPWGSAITFAVDDDLKFYFMTRADTLKYKNIEANHNVSLTVADETEQISVQSVGVVSRVDTDDYMDVVFKKLASV